mmetsp:Transcript_81491/g.207050  ORF Transcript_81491/g.207050 Transcript_81491/m.207050 type:complete len:214 (-) Transcript_81491:175-816(-)
MTPSEPEPIGVCSGVCTRMRRPVSTVSGWPVGDASVAVRRPVEPKACPGMHMSPQPLGPESKRKPGGAMMSSSRITDEPWSTSRMISMVAFGGLRTTVTVSKNLSTGLKPLEFPSLVFVKPSFASVVSMRQVLTPEDCGYTRRLTVYGVSAINATSDAGLLGFNVAFRPPVASSITGMAAIWPVPMMTKPSVLIRYPGESPAPWHLMTRLPVE